MRGRGAVAAAALALVATGGCSDDSGGQGAGGDLPAACDTETPLTIEVEGGEHLPGIDGPQFVATSIASSVQPILPDPDADPGDVDLDAVKREAAETDLVAYTVHLADFDLGPDDLAMFGVTPPADGTLLSLTVVPPTEAGLATGDVVEGGRPEFESTTTFATLGMFYDSGLNDPDDGVFLGTEGEDAGRAEILHVDDERLCLSFSQSGPIFGTDTDAQWSIDLTVATELGPRQTLPFT